LGKKSNEITFGFLNKIPYRDAIKKRLEVLYSYERLTAPFKEGDYYYFYKNNGLQTTMFSIGKRRWNA